MNKPFSLNSFKPSAVFMKKAYSFYKMTSPKEACKLCLYNKGMCENYFIKIKSYYN